jgi:hypothetical protein
VVYTEFSVGSTLTWSLYRVFTRYLSFAISLNNSEVLYSLHLI